MAIEKAVIEIVAGAHAGDRIPVLFNPNEYSIERSNSFKATTIVGLSGPLLHFINGEADVLSMELFLDDYTDRGTGPSVAQRLDALAALLEIDRELHAPPPVCFLWGTLNFKAVIEKLSRKITLFRPDGTPARATLSVSFREYKTLTELIRDVPLQSSDKTKRRCLNAGEALWALAAAEYGDAALWKVIAEHNDLDDPRELPPGTWVTVPPLEDRDGTRAAF
ncbi:LysM peptidoglycan-binding domain-containing protein [Variovorax sp. J2P1-59]|uniref:CIS tube protein n=1 Tax=Variovorax flavidus TaxID=3053501 RepID=UPI0025763625|nr:LysM peptidoglycan-binding domain-containing protein [Variovorax sp. J2P1-59]MDM0076895.1 LysM peptidoglycan-binding domain-containing protein [Variovorax sp. J2P1-59]